MKLFSLIILIVALGKCHSKKDSGGISVRKIRNRSVSKSYETGPFESYGGGYPISHEYSSLSSEYHPPPGEYPIEYPFSEEFPGAYEYPLETPPEYLEAPPAHLHPGYAALPPPGHVKVKYIDKTKKKAKKNYFWTKILEKNIAKLQKKLAKNAVKPHHHHKYVTGHGHYAPEYPGGALYPEYPSSEYPVKTVHRHVYHPKEPQLVEVRVPKCNALATVSETVTETLMKTRYVTRTQTKYKTKTKTAKEYVLNTVTTTVTGSPETVTVTNHLTGAATQQYGQVETALSGKKESEGGAFYGEALAKLLKSFS